MGPGECRDPPVRRRQRAEPQRAPRGSDAEGGLEAEIAGARWAFQAGGRIRGGSLGPRCHDAAGV